MHRNGPQLRLKLLAALLCAAVDVALFALLGPARVIEGSSLEDEAATGQARYSKFSHDIAAHKVDCSKCHTFPSKNWKAVRPAESAFADITEYPSHASCINCHRQQFFRGARPQICTICHANPGPRNSTRHPFPNPREKFDASPKGKDAESEFDINFPHETHIEIVSQLRPREVEFVRAGWTTIRRSEESCKVCHQTHMPQGDSDEEYAIAQPKDLGDNFWLKKGTFKTSPIGHTTCFTCHSPDTGIEPAPTNCAACHAMKQKPPPADFDKELWARVGLRDRIIRDAWSTRYSSGTYRHEFPSHAELDCATCHDVSAMKTLDPRSMNVAITSCNNCHITATSDDGGILNFEIDSRKADASFRCVKCHLSFGTQPIPESHIKAVAAMAGN